MDKFEVKVSREWNKRQIDTIVKSTDTELAITMPLPEFLTLLCGLTAQTVPMLSTRRQIQSAIIVAATEAVAQMKENTRQVMLPGVARAIS